MSAAAEMIRPVLVGDDKQKIGSITHGQLSGSLFFEALGMAVAVSTPFVHNILPEPDMANEIKRGVCEPFPPAGLTRGQFSRVRLEYECGSRIIRQEGAHTRQHARAGAWHRERSAKGATLPLLGRNRETAKRIARDIAKHHGVAA